MSLDDLRKERVWNILKSVNPSYVVLGLAESFINEWENRRRSGTLNKWRFERNYPVMSDALKEMGVDDPHVHDWLYGSMRSLSQMITRTGPYKKLYEEYLASKSIIKERSHEDQTRHQESTT